MEKFLAEGQNVVATLRDPAQWAGDQFHRLMVQALDIRDEASVAEAVTATVDRFGRLDVVVNNAGMGLFSVFEAAPACTSWPRPPRRERNRLLRRHLSHNRSVRRHLGNRLGPDPPQLRSAVCGVLLGPVNRVLAWPARLLPRTAVARIAGASNRLRRLHGSSTSPRCTAASGIRTTRSTAIS
ncbi:SDR family NAD(P)-dependent oxidoreductase [Micromonospora sp. C51]|uniref:SDR family NAD(P)-dependent oxidoreductase n=1 Tax=Micromonospora sp. C51 TaxID=2824879 RepID=UPI001B373DA3|nr:SDR family NAD(P)-dependent oxidoreductase [Micromonospora sp. C51]MBQ1053108.1 SDR family NAD(P)-dependent oxidoreductase [Micromonospora sp. C51]